MAAAIECGVEPEDFGGRSVAVPVPDWLCKMSDYG